MGKVINFLKVNYIYIILAILVIADGVMSNLIIQSGNGSEGNGFLMGIAGSWKLIALKILGVFLVVTLLVRCAKKRPLATKIVTYFGVGFYSLIMGWNLVWIAL